MPEDLSQNEEITSLGITPPSDKSKRLKISLGILGLVFILTSIPAAIYLAKQRQEIRKQASDSDACGGGGIDTFAYIGNQWVEGSGDWKPGGGNTIYDINQFPLEGGNYVLKFLPYKNNQPLPSNLVNAARYGWAQYSPSISADTDRFPDSGAGFVAFHHRDELHNDFPVQGSTLPYSINLNYLFDNFNSGKIGGTLIVKTFVGRDTSACRDNLTARIQIVTSTPTPTPGPTATPTLTPTPTLPPDTVQCEFCKVYDQDWEEITDLSTLAVGQTVYFATRGSTTHPQGITKARFRINSGTWQETTSKHGNEFYIQYTFPSAGSYTVESMVYNPVLGWY